MNRVVGLGRTDRQDYFSDWFRPWFGVSRTYPDFGMLVTNRRCSLRWPSDKPLTLELGNRMDLASPINPGAPALMLPYSIRGKASLSQMKRQVRFEIVDTDRKARECDD